MKIIEAMRNIKILNEKISDLKSKIRDNSTDTDNVQPAYGTVDNQLKKVSEWIQSCKDSVRDIEKMRLGIQNTNLKTNVAITLNGKSVEKPIAAWIHRRRDLAEMERGIWRSLTDEGWKGGGMKDEKTGEIIAVNVRRYFDKEKRDQKIQEFSEEPHLIDAALEIANATTDVEFV